MVDGGVTLLGANVTYMANVASVVWLDVILSGDNALVIGVAAASAPARWRRRVILLGLLFATLFRIGFAAAATYLLHVPGLLVAGGLALWWVSWGLYK
ncbi:MAG: TerC family protein, partial [Alphaproteobacteria bacterium]